MPATPNMTLITGDHDYMTCREAGRQRKQVVDNLKKLIYCLEVCQPSCKKDLGESFPPQWARPLITYPDTKERARTFAVQDKVKSASQRPSVAVVGGKLVNGCDCVKRNGLQADCELPDCQGRDLCLVKPFPLCPPSGRAEMMVTPEQAACVLGQLNPIHENIPAPCREYEACNRQCMECNATLSDICKWHPGWFDS